MPPIQQRPTSNTLTTGVAAGPGRFSVPESSPGGATLKYELGDRQADREFNGDGLYLSAEARLRSAGRGQDSLERLRVTTGVEGVAAKIDLVRDGEAKPHFAGLSLKDGYFKGQVNDARDYLKENPAAAVGAAVGAVAIAHVIAKETGDDIKIDTGKVKLYENGGLTASVVGEIAITGKSSIIRGQGAKAVVGYTDYQYGNFSVEAGYDRDERIRAQANWSKTFDSGLEARAGAFYEQRSHNAGVSVGLSYRF